MKKFLLVLALALCPWLVLGVSISYPPGAGGGAAGPPGPAGAGGAVTNTDGTLVIGTNSISGTVTARDVQVSITGVAAKGVFPSGTIYLQHTNGTVTTYSTVTNALTAGAFGETLYIGQGINQMGSATWSTPGNFTIVGAGSQWNPLTALVWNNPTGSATNFSAFTPSTNFTMTGVSIVVTNLPTVDNCYAFPVSPNSNGLYMGCSIYGTTDGIYGNTLNCGTSTVNFCDVSTPWDCVTVGAGDYFILNYCTIHPSGPLVFPSSMSPSRGIVVQNSTLELNGCRISSVNISNNASALAEGIEIQGGGTVIARHSTFSATNTANAIYAVDVFANAAGMGTLTLDRSDYTTVTNQTHLTINHLDGSAIAGSLFAAPSFVTILANAGVSGVFSQQLTASTPQIGSAALYVSTNTTASSFTTYFYATAGKSAIQQVFNSWQGTNKSITITNNTTTHTWVLFKNLDGTNTVPIAGNFDFPSTPGLGAVLAVSGDALGGVETNLTLFSLQGTYLEGGPDGGIRIAQNTVGGANSFSVQIGQGNTDGVGDHSILIGMSNSVTSYRSVVIGFNDQEQGESSNCVFIGEDNASSSSNVFAGDQTAFLIMIGSHNRYGHFVGSEPGLEQLIIGNYSATYSNNSAVLGDRLTNSLANSLVTYPTYENSSLVPGSKYLTSNQVNAAISANTSFPTNTSPLVNSKITVTLNNRFTNVAQRAGVEIHYGVTSTLTANGGIQFINVSQNETNPPLAIGGVAETLSNCVTYLVSPSDICIISNVSQAGASAGIAQVKLRGL